MNHHVTHTFSHLSIGPSLPMHPSRRRDPRSYCWQLSIALRNRGQQPVRPKTKKGSRVDVSPCAAHESARIWPCWAYSADMMRRAAAPSIGVDWLELISVFGKTECADQTRRHHAGWFNLVGRRCVADWQASGRARGGRRRADSAGPAGAVCGAVASVHGRTGSVRRSAAGHCRRLGACADSGRDRARARRTRSGRSRDRVARVRGVQALSTRSRCSEEDAHSFRCLADPLIAVVRAAPALASVAVHSWASRSAVCPTVWRATRPTCARCR